MTDSEMIGPSAVVKAAYWYPDGETTPTSGGVVARSSAILIESTLFTHLFCAFAELDPHTHQVIIPRQHEYEFSTFTNTVQLKNRNVKTLLSIGGRNPRNAAAFASMASNRNSRKSFIESSIWIARSNRFKGLDLAWAYPNSIQEMRNFGQLLVEWRSAVENESRRSGAERLLLTAAVYYSTEYNSVSYPVRPIKESLDWVNIIAYEFYGLTTDIGPPAGLYDPSPKKGPCGDSGLRLWLEAGLPEKKAVFGFPYVGWTWSFEDANDNGYEVATTRVAITADGPINYDQIRKFIANHKAITGYDPTVVGNYCFAGTTLILYDDIESVVTKVEYAKYKSLRGYFAWNVGADDDSRLSLAAAQAWDDAIKPLAEE